MTKFIQTSMGKVEAYGFDAQQEVEQNIPHSRLPFVQTSMGKVRDYGIMQTFNPPVYIMGVEFLNITNQAGFSLSVPTSSIRTDRLEGFKISFAGSAGAGNFRLELFDGASEKVKIPNVENVQFELEGFNDGNPLLLPFAEGGVRYQGSGSGFTGMFAYLLSREHMETKVILTPIFT